MKQGTVNAPAIIGLGVSAEFVGKIGPDVIGRYEEDLITCLDENLMNMEFVKLYGPSPSEKTGISLITIDGLEAEEVTALLNNDYQIAVRGRIPLRRTGAQDYRNMGYGGGEDQRRPL